MENETTAARDSMVIYRSFYEAIKELPRENQAEVWEAVFELGFNHTEIVLNGLSKTIFTLIKPIIDANYKRWENGSKPKQHKSETEAGKKQNRSKTEAKPKQGDSKVEANKDKDVDKDKEKDVNEDKDVSGIREAKPRLISTNHRGKKIDWYENEVAAASECKDKQISSLKEELGDARFAARLGHYKSLIEYMLNGNAMDCPAGMHDTVLMLKEQLSFIQYSNLADEAKSPTPIREVITEMHNSYAKNVRGKTTVYKTALNWLKRRMENPPSGNASQQTNGSTVARSPREGEYTR